MSQPFQQILQAAAKLPPFPQAAQKALALLENPDVSAANLVAVVELDASLTATVLRTANSAYFGRQGKVDNIKQALTLLGNRSFRDMVVTAASSGFMGKGQQGYQLAPGDLWRHSVATGLLAQVLCERLGIQPGPALFTAALLHDMGKLVLTSFVQDKALAIKELVAQGKSFLEAERQVLEMDHAELGARIAEGWHFSPAMVELIRFHHEPQQRPESRELSVLYLANVMCKLYGLGGGSDALAAHADGSVLERLKLTIDDVEASLAEMQMRLDKASTMLDLGGR